MRGQQSIMRTTIKTTYTFGLDLSVNEGTGKSSEEFLCLCVVVGLAVFRNVIFVSFHRLQIHYQLYVTD